MAYSYQQIWDSIPRSYSDYIRDSHEQVSLVNQATRRACMNTRRYNKITSNAPFPIDVISSPLATRNRDLVTWEYEYQQETQTPNAQEQSLNRWTNGVQSFEIKPIYVSDYRLYIPIVDFPTPELANQCINKDCCVTKRLVGATEYIPGKWLGVVDYETSPGSVIKCYAYVAQPGYVKPLKINKITTDYVYFAKQDNKYIDYYFIPQHTQEGLYSSDTGNQPMLLKWQVNPNSPVGNLQFTLHNYNGLDIHDWLLLQVQGLQGYETVTNFGFIQGQVATTFTPIINQTYNITWLDSNGLVVTTTQFTAFINDLVIDVPEIFTLSEEFIGDPILLNLIRLEIKKSIAEFIDDTSTPGLIQLYDNEIDKETQRVMYTVNTPVIESVSDIQYVNPGIVACM